MEDVKIMGLGASRVILDTEMGLDEGIISRYNPDWDDPVKHLITFTTKDPGLFQSNAKVTVNNGEVVVTVGDYVLEDGKDYTVEPAGKTILLDSLAAMIEPMSMSIGWTKEMSEFKSEMNEKWMRRDGYSSKQRSKRVDKQAGTHRKKSKKARKKNRKGR